MILPPDTKSAAGPQSSSSDSPTSPTSPTTAISSSSRTSSPLPSTRGTHYGDRPLPYSQVWRNPNGTHEETSPLLEHEYTPAPPYSPHDPSGSADDLVAKTTAIQRTRRRFWLALPCAFLIYLAVLLIADLIVDLIPDVDIHPGNPDRHHRGGGGSGNGGGTPEEQERNDGSPIECLSFPSNKWAEYDQQGKSGMLFKSQKKTVYVNSAMVDENFVHLAGPASVARVFVDTYQSLSVFGTGSRRPPPTAAPGEAIIMHEGTAGDAPDDDEMEAMYGARGMIRIVIEPVIRILEPNATPDEGNSPGVEMLAASKICVMQRDAPPSNFSHPPTPPRHKHRSPRELGNGDDKPLTSQGLGVYTHRPKADQDHNRYQDALKFNIYISLPEEYPPTFMELLLIAMGYEIPRGYVRSFEIRGDITDIDVNAPQQRTGRFLINTALGKVDFKNFVAEYVKVHTQAGSITGSVDIASMLVLESETGTIDMDIGLAPAPSALIWPPPGVKPMSVKSGKGCDLPAVLVSSHTDAGSIKLRYNKWSQMCRGLKQNLRTELGSIQLRGHPNFEGPFYMSNEVGSISVELDDSAKDPTERMRRRVWTMNRSGQIGGSCAWGDVSWSSDRGPREWSEGANATALSAAQSKLSCPKKGIDPSLDDYDPMASSLNIESEVGSIHVVL